MILWITGLPGAGKTTLAKKLYFNHYPAVILDGDDCRKWLTPDCTFTKEDRLKHAQRIWKVAELIDRAGGIAICSLVAHPPPEAKPDMLYYVTGRSKPLWENTTYEPPANPDVVVYTG